MPKKVKLIFIYLFLQMTPTALQVSYNKISPNETFPKAAGMNKYGIMRQ